MRQDKNIALAKLSVTDLERALKILARVVSLYGETYLPLFNRLYDDLLKAKEADKMKALALQLALRYSETE
ncbi:MAG TPA: hypothetical protein VHA52_10485 [Candidatus Babeliaceae bacterium]|nr:hypothetical protein [Candidatus Babeliaceae bacterium]